VYFLLLLLLLLSISDSDAALSVRWLRTGRIDHDIVAWPVWLLKIQLSLVYFFTAIAKLNPTFLSGQVLGDRAWIPPPLTTPAGLALLGFGAVALEFFIGFALWLPKLRYWAFLIGLILHGIVPIVMGPYAGLIVFSLATLSVYVLFMDDRPASRLVLWDDRCGGCARWIALFRRLDWLAIHRFEGSSRTLVLKEAGVTADRANEEILFWDGQKLYGGFDAVREILKALPVSMLWAQVLAIEPIRWVGIRAYRAVARRRVHCHVVRS
jgi:predicted DCC family thiol-disulfide oxidoreductase YuxK